MTSIGMEKSIILPWTREDVNKAPEACGVFLLRTTPINGDIVVIENSVNIKADLEKIFSENNFGEVKFFDWYKTTDIRDAEQLQRDLKSKYHIEERENQNY